VLHSRRAATVDKQRDRAAERQTTMSERKPWTRPYTDAEWIGIAFAILGLVMLGVFAYVIYSILTIHF
jgi:hypothetical protein